MNYLVVIGGVILVIALYFLYLYLTNTNLSSGIQDLNAPNNVPSKNLDSPNSTVFSYQFWIFMAQPTTGAKTILARKDAGGNRFNIQLDGTKLQVCNASNSATNTVLYTATNQFPIQKWSYVVVNYDQSTQLSECYINGKLVYTINLKAAIDMGYGVPLIIGMAGLKGYITKVIYKPETISSDQVWKNYLEGNGQLSISSYFAGYNLNMAISKDDVVQRNWKLFT